MYFIEYVVKFAKACGAMWHVDALEAGAMQFETTATKLKRKYWWENMKVFSNGFWFLHTPVVTVLCMVPGGEFWLNFLDGGEWCVYDLNFFGFLGF